MGSSVPKFYDYEVAFDWNKKNFFEFKDQSKLCEIMYSLVNSWKIIKYTSGNN